MPEEVEESERIDVAGGNVSVPGIYEGPVTCHIESEFYCFDIYVEFDPDLVLPKVMKKYGGLYDCPPFCKAVAALIAEQNDLGEGEYDLDRAELGMQGNTYCAFEGFSKDKKGIGREFFESKGAVDLSAIEDEKQKKREAELEALLTGEHGRQLAIAYRKVFDLVEMTRANLKASLLSSYRAEINLYIGELLGFPNDYLEDLGFDDEPTEEQEIQRHLERKLMSRFKENIIGHFHTPDSMVLEIKINDEDKPK